MAAKKKGTKRTADSRFIWLATLVLLVGAGFRLVQLSDVPPGLSQDEVLNADIVRFILQGEHTLFFRHGFGHEPLYHYYSVPFQILLGDNVLAIRLPVVFLGMAAMAITMRWAKRYFGRITALVAGLGMAISWWAIIFSRVGIRPMLEVVLLASAVWAWPVNPWLAGGLLGLSIYSYTGARYIFLLPLGLLLYLLIFHRRGQTLDRKQAHSYGSIRTALIVFLISLAFYVPLALTLRADPSLQQRVGQLSGPLDALWQGDFQPIVSMAVATLGVFSVKGDPRWTYSLPGRPLFDLLTALFFYAGAIIVLWRWRRPLYALLIIWFGLTLMPSIVTPDAPSTIRLIGLMPLVYLLPGISISFLWSQWRTWVERVRPGQRLLLTLPWLVLVILLGLNVWRTMQDGFERWTQATETRLKYQTVIQDMARHWEGQGEPAMVVAEPFFEPIDADTLRRTLGRDPEARWVQNGQRVAGAVVIPSEPGKAQLYVPEFAPPPAALLEAVGIDGQPSYRSEESPSFAVYDLPSTAPNPENPLSVTLDDKITLVGYDLLEMNERQIRLVTYWRIEGALADDSTIFTHLLNEEGEIVAQHDGFDAAPQSLRSGDLVIQYHVLSLPDGLTSGPFVLQSGMYRRGDEQRLMHPGTPADRIFLLDELFLTNE